VSRNTAPRTPRLPRWNIVKTSRRWCLGFNWISSKISRKRWIGEGEELTKGRNVQLLAVQVYSQCGARGVRGARGAVFRDIDEIHFTGIRPYIVTPRYRSENSRLNTVFRGLHSVHKWVFRQSWFQSSAAEMQALACTGNRLDTLMKCPAGSSTLYQIYYYEKLSPLTSHGQICPLESKI